MARRRKHKNRDQPLDPEAVADGRLDMRPGQLFDLIHEVNPTGRDPPIVFTDTYNFPRFSHLRTPRRLADRRALVRRLGVGGSRAG
jgi:hypothetical protein